MTLAQLQTAAAKPNPILNVRALSRAIGRSGSYLSTYLAAGRELPAEVQDAIDAVLSERLGEYGRA